MLTKAHALSKALEQVHLSGEPAVVLYDDRTTGYKFSVARLSSYAKDKILQEKDVVCVVNPPKAAADAVRAESENRMATEQSAKTRSYVRPDRQIRA